MGLKTRRNEPFSTVTKDAAVEGDDVVFIKGGSTAINGKWIQFDDLRVDVSDLVDAWISTRATRIFNKKNGILYILIALTEDQALEVVPSISLNQTVTGNITTFESLSNKLPLLLVKLEQDGSNDMSSYKAIGPGSIEVYKGYGNFTTRGASGLTGPVGDTGIQGQDGMQGMSGSDGDIGLTGDIGPTGPQGPMGDTGSDGIDGEEVPREPIERPGYPEADFVASPVLGTQPMEVQFTNLSVGEWESIIWDFGDGNTSTNENPTHTYTAGGVYTVTLYLQGIDGDSEKIRYDYITVTCAIQKVVDEGTPGGSWDKVVDSTKDEIQKVVGGCV